MTRHDKTRQDMTRQDMTRQDKTRQGQDIRGNEIPFHECLDGEPVKPGVLTVSHLLRSDCNYSSDIVRVNKYLPSFR